MFWHFFIESFSENAQAILGWFDKHNGFIQAIATLVLVVITFRSIKEAENTRKDTRLPIVKFDIRGPINYGNENQYIEFSAENVGYGLAFDVELNFTFNKIGPISMGNIEAGSKRDFRHEISDDELEAFSKATKFWDVVSLSYKDTFDRTLLTFATLFDENQNTSRKWPDIKVSKWRVTLPD